MSSTALKTLAVIMVALAVILGFVAYQLSQNLTTEKVAEAPPPPPADQVLAVVATKRIPAYEPITEESVALVPISVEPPQYYTDLQSVVGRPALRPIPVGTTITDESFSGANTLAQAIPTGMQAMSLGISDVVAVGGFVKPGDTVDVLIYIRASGSEVEDSQARVLLESARVLAYEERLINASADDTDGGPGQQQRRERTAVLAVPEKQTTKVMLGASLGELRLALRPTNEKLGANITGDGAPASEDDDKPEVLAQLTAADASPKADKKGEKEEDRDEKEKAITLAELSEIKKKSKPKPAARRSPRPAPRATIEVYEGTELKRISRPY